VLIESAARARKYSLSVLEVQDWDWDYPCTAPFFGCCPMHCYLRSKISCATTARSRGKFIISEYSGLQRQYSTELRTSAELLLKITGLKYREMIILKRAKKEVFQAKSSARNTPAKTV